MTDLPLPESGSALIPSGDPERDAFLSANLGAIAGRFPVLADLIASVKPASLELIETPRGLPSARLGGKSLHSAHDPEKEARRLVESLSPAADTVVLLGFGLGYAAEACLSTDSLRVLVVEAEIGLLRAALSLRDLRGILADERLSFMAGGGPEAVLPALEAIGARRIGLLGLSAVEQQASAWYGEVRAALERFSAKENVNENTLNRFGRLWVRNLSRNLALIGRLPGTAELEKAFPGLPALVLAAGPSLDQVLPRIRELSGRCLIICVDTALRSLLREGIEPDFLVVVDPQYWNWRHLGGLPSPRSILISESAAWPAVFRFGTRAAFLAGSVFPLGRAIEKSVGFKGMLGAGGSVATSAWAFACLIGASPIYMAGLDLSFPEGATHARASFFEQCALSNGSRLAPTENAQAGALLGADSLQAPNNSGGLVRTDRRMALYSWWFESRLARKEATATWNLSAQGLAIPGMPLASIEDILSLPLRRPEIDEILRSVASRHEDPGAEARAGQGIASLLADLARIEAGANRAARIASAALEARDPEPFLIELGEIDAELLGNASRDIAGFLLPSLEKTLGGRARNLSESLEKSLTLYKRVAESANYHISVLADTAKKHSP